MWLLCIVSKCVFSPTPREERRFRILPRELESDRGRKKRKEI